MEAKKRKREDEETLLTFYAPDRTFSRVYKGQSLEETKELVRRKLGLVDGAPVHLARLHEGTMVELDDEDDFEAFRHLIRYVSSVDVSVLVGSNGPTLMKQASSRQTAPGPLKKRRDKRRGLGLPTSTPFSSPLPSSGRPVPSSSSAPASVSTLNEDAIPHKKRRRKGGTALAAQDASRSSSQMSEPLRSSPSVNARPVGDSIDIMASTARPTESTPPSEARSVLPRGSKRKRIGSPEPPASVTTVLPVLVTAASSPPASQASSTKKRRKGKVTEIPSPAMTVEPNTAIASDKRGERIDDVDESVVCSAHEDGSSSTVGRSQGKKAARKAKREARLKETLSTAASQDVNVSPDSSLADVRDKQMQSRHAVIPEHADEPVQAQPILPQAKASLGDPKASRQKQQTKTSRPRLPNATSGSAPLDDVELGSAKRAQRTSRTEDAQLSEVNPDHAAQPDPGSTSMNSSSKTKSGKRPKGKTTHAETVAGAEASSASTSISAAPVGEANMSSDEPNALESASTNTKKAKRKNGKASSTSSSDLMAAVQAAYQAVMARGPPAGTTIAGTNPTSSSEPPLPLRKRNAGKSKLSQTWGPTDLADERASLGKVATVQGPPSTADVSHGTKQAKETKPRTSSAPVCIICDQASVHPRSQCPIVVAGSASLSKRITQLKKAGQDPELTTELENLLNEARRRRKTAGDAPVAATPILPSNHVPPVTIPDSEEASPSSPELPLQTLSASTLKRPSLRNRSLSSPQLPAGSEISEVAVESRDEGSSNESSSDDDFSSIPPPTVIPDSSNFESLLWGPVKPRGSILARLPSSSESGSDNGNEGSDDEQDKEDIDLDEEDMNDRAYRRMSRRFYRAASSSDEEPEPEADPENFEVNVHDVLVPATLMDADANNSMEDAREVEAGVLDNSAALHTVFHSDEDGNGNGDDLESSAVSSKALEREASPASESGESPAKPGVEVPSTGGNIGRDVESVAEVIPPASQHSEPPIEESGQQEQPKAVEGPLERAESETSVSVGRYHAHSLRDDIIAEVEKQGSPELGEAPSIPSAQVAFSDEEEHEDHGTQMRVEVIKPHTEDPTDPIDYFSSDHDKEQPEDFVEDPIEDADGFDENALRRQTPPPETPSTPGTVARMKDRYGRLLRHSPRHPTPQLPQQSLDDLTWPERGNTQFRHVSQEQEQPVEREEAGADDSQEMSLAVQEPAESSARPRRTTRTASRLVTSLSQPEPSSTPTLAVYAPTQRRRGRLTEEEKAQREAEKQEKKIERDRKAAEKRAEKEAKDAAKRAEKDAKAAAKQAAKEEKEAAKRAAKGSAANPGGRTTRGRGRGGTAKPASTRAQPVVASVDEDENWELPEGNQDKTLSGEILAGTPSTARVSWATLPQTQQRTQTESVGDVESSMFDELQPSSPEPVVRDEEVEAHGERTMTQTGPPADPARDGHATLAATPKGRRDPLFIPSSSQVPMTPFSASDVLTASTPFDQSSQREDEGDAGDRAKTIARSRPRTPWVSQSVYTSLTALSGQPLFTASQIPSPALFSQTPKTNHTTKLDYAQLSTTDDESDDDSSDSSDSDASKKKSHIPQNRRAGAGVQKKKKSGLLSAFG